MIANSSAMWNFPVGVRNCILVSVPSNERSFARVSLRPEGNFYLFALAASEHPSSVTSLNSRRIMLYAACLSSFNLRASYLDDR